MPNPICPFAVQRPGADSPSNGGRIIAVRAHIWHRPQGRCPGVVSVGESRHHSSPGTFPFTLCHDGTLYQHYPVNVRCSHAAGANYSGPGTEVEDYDETPLHNPQIATGGKLARWLRDEWGIPFDFYDGPRIWLDQSNYRGHINHGSVAYPPNTSYHHVDDIKRAEFNSMVAGSVPGPPAPQQEEDEMRVIIDIDDPDKRGAHFLELAGDRRWMVLSKNERELIVAAKQAIALRRNRAQAGKLGVYR